MYKIILCKRNILPRKKQKEFYTREKKKRIFLYANESYVSRLFNVEFCAKRSYFFLGLAIRVGTKFASVFAAVLAFLAAARQFTRLPVHQRRPGSRLLPTVVIFHKTGDGFVR